MAKKKVKKHASKKKSVKKKSVKKSSKKKVAKKSAKKSKSRIKKHQSEKTKAVIMSPAVRKELEGDSKKKPRMFFDGDDEPHARSMGHHVSSSVRKETKRGLKKQKHYVTSKGKMVVHRPAGSLDKLRSKPGKFRSSKEERVGTGIPGLDSVMEGGFKPGSVTMVGGGAGSGKSIFSMQFLMDGIEKANESAVYITFEQTPEALFSDMQRFNFDLEDKVKKKKLIVLHYTPEQVEKVLQSGGGTVRDAIEEIGAKRVVIDSLTAFALLHETDSEQRRALLQLFEAVKKWGCTTLVISEKEPDPEKHLSDTMEFEADGVILIYNIRRGHERERSLEIFKMRGIHHSQRIYPLTITDKGIHISPQDTVF